MKKNLWNILRAILFCLCVCLPRTVMADGLFPAWRTGETWLVKAVYHSALQKGEWSAPVLWEYHIKSCEKSESGCVLEVKNHGTGPELTARLIYRSDDFSLVSAEITKTRRGKDVAKILTYKGGVPARAEQTLIPSDTPVFPLRFPSSADFTVTSPVSRELKTTDTIRQEVRQVTGKIEDLPDRSPEKPLTEVKCTTGNGKLVFIQYWSENLPFPLFGQNENMKYWMVMEQGAGDGEQVTGGRAK